MKEWYNIVIVHILEESLYEPILKHKTVLAHLRSTHFSRSNVADMYMLISL